MKKISLWVLLGLLLAVVLGACGGGGDEVDTSTFKEASAELLGVTIGHPAEWAVRTNDEGIQLATDQALFDTPGDVEEGAMMMVTGFDKAMIGLISEEEVDVEDPVALLNMFSKLALEGDETAVVRDEAKAITLNGHAAAQMVIDTKTDAGKEVYGQLTAVPNENAIIFIFAATPKAQEEEMGGMFSAMYSTIKLTTPAVDSEEAAEAVAAIEEEVAPTEEPAPTAVPTNTPAPTATTAPTATPAPTEAPDLAADFTETAAEDIGFAISHPADWVSNLAENGDLSLASEEALLDNPQDVKEGMMVQITNLPADALAFMLPADADPNDPAAVLDMFIGLITGISDESNPTSFTEREAATATTIAGYDAATALYEVSSENLDGLVKFVAISDPDNNRVAFLFAATPLATEEEYLPVLDAMLETITLSTPTVALGGNLMGGEPVSLYATSAFASTEYGTDSWSAMQATGEPDTLECGDQSTAWASAASNGVDWLELTYDQTVYVTQINIHQSYNPDQVVLVELVTPESDVVPVYESVPFEFTDEACPFMLAIPLDGTILANGVRITVDQSQLTLGWNEIDAVELIGIPSN